MTPPDAMDCTESHRDDRAYRDHPTRRIAPAARQPACTPRIAGLPRQAAGPLALVQSAPSATWRESSAQRRTVTDGSDRQPNSF